MWHELKHHAQGVAKGATLRTLARLLEPSVPNGFVWVKHKKSAMAKRAPGGNGNNKPSVTLEQQLEQEGVEPLNPRTFQWADAVFDGVPRKGEADKINDHVDTLFDNTWLAQNAVRRVRPCMHGPLHHPHVSAACRSRSCARTCAPRALHKSPPCSGTRPCPHSLIWWTSKAILSAS